MRYENNIQGRFAVFLLRSFYAGCLLFSSFLIAQNQTLSVTPTSLSLGSQTTADFVTTSAVSVSYDKDNWTDFTLRVFTQNSGGQPGLVGQTDSNLKLPFKIWTANFGPSSTMPDPAVCPNWTDHWAWVPDKAEMLSSNKDTWRRLTWKGPNDDATVTSPFDIHFGFDLAKHGYSGQSYSTTIYFELIDKYDNDTGAQSVQATFAMDLTLSLSVDGTISLDVSGLTQTTTMNTTDTRILVSGTLFASARATGLRSINAASDHNALAIRTYTDNNPGSPSVIQHGLVGQSDPNQTVAVKVWTSNFGDGIDDNADGIPDVDNDANWKSDTAATWLYAFDKNEAISEVAPWNYAMFDHTDLIKLSDNDPLSPLPAGVLYEDPGGSCSDDRIPVHFAMVLDGKAAPQTYSSKIYVDLAMSTDFGATFTTVSDSVTLTVNLLDATPLITVTSDQTTLSFPALATFSGRTMAQGHVELSMDALGLHPYDAIALRMFTDNGADVDGHVRLGMLGDQRADWSVPLRAWTLNYGLGVDGNGDGIADIDNDDNWKGGNGSTVWVFVQDLAEPAREDWSHITDPNDPFYDGQNAWGRPLFDFTELFRWSDYHDRTDAFGDFIYHVPQHLRLIDRTANDGDDVRVAVYFAADFTDAIPQSYSTSLTIEAAFSSDSGNTVIRTESVQVDLSAVVPGNGTNRVAWLQNRVDMRPDMDSSNGTVDRLADSQQNENDLADSGFIYDQALAIFALTREGDDVRVQEILNGLRYLQNNDGSFFFSYMTNVDDALLDKWVTTDDDNNGLPDELEKRVNWAADHSTSQDSLDEELQQIKSWIYTDYSTTVCPQTETTLPDKIKYRTIDFRKFAGTIGWLAMSIAYYEYESGDSQYRDVLDGTISYLKSIQQTSQATATDLLDYGGVRLGRGFFKFAHAPGTNGFGGVPAVDGFINLRSYSIEHNLDAYSAFRYYADLTGDLDAENRAQLIRSFIFNKLWAPDVNLTDHPEAVGLVENCFFVGFDVTDFGLTQNPLGLLNTNKHFLDAQSWAVLAFGADVAVNDKNGVAGTLDMAVAFLDETDTRAFGDINGASINPAPYLKVTNQTIFSGTGAAVSGIDGYKEAARDSFYQTTANPTGNFVWSEGTEGVVAARYLAGETTDADYYHDETASYTLTNGGVPYSTTSPPDSAAYISRGKAAWSFGDNASVAGTAWYLFNEEDAGGNRLNPFQPYDLPITPGGNEVFFEDFESYAAAEVARTADWTVIKGTLSSWNAISDAGTMWLRNNGSTEQMLEIDAAAPADFTLSTDIRFPSTSSHQAGLFFRKESSSNYYIFYLEEGQGATSTWAAVFGKITNNVFSKILGIGIGETVAINKTYSLKVEASGSNFKFYIDKGAGYTLLMDVNQSAYTSGTVGLRGYTAGSARWDNVSLIDPNGNPGILEYAPLPYSTGFESGEFDQYWETHTTNEGRTRLVTTNSPFSAPFHMVMDDSVNAGNYSQNEAWLKLNLEDKSDVYLDFQWKEFGDETHTQDGVYFSDDGGATFTKVQDLNGGSYSNQTWTSFSLHVDQLASSNGLTLSSTFVVKFQQYDNYAIATDGFAIDNIAVVERNDYATLPYSTGFESGTLDGSWLTFSTNDGRARVLNTNTPHAGSYHLLLDDAVNGSTYSQNEAWLQLDLDGETGVTLDFWWKEFGDENHSQDGVYFSDDGGASFTKVQDLNGQSYTNQTWTSFSLDVDALATANNLSLTSTFVVKFQQYDNYAITTDGFAFDDISVTSSLPKKGEEDTANSLLPKEFALGHNYPNPFNPTTSIKIALPKHSKVHLQIFDVTGRLVRTLLNEPREAGYHIVRWNGRSDAGYQVASGIYFYRMAADTFVKTHRMILLK